MNFKNSKKQGDSGMGAAINYFTSNEYCVSIPLTDSQPYDLVVDRDGLETVQVKTSTHRNPQGRYVVELRTKGGNRSGTGKTTHFADHGVDLLFILTGDESTYLLPVALIASQSTITMGRQYDEYRCLHWCRQL